MLNVLKNSILIVLFVLVSSSGILAKGQNLSFKETCLERKFCRNEICEVSTVPFFTKVANSHWVTPMLSRTPNHNWFPLSCKGIARTTLR